MAFLDRSATELNRDVWTYVEIEGHTIQDAMEHFGIAKRTVYQHMSQYRDRNPLPDEYINNLRKRAKVIAQLGLDAIEDNLRSDKPDLHTALQVNKGTGVLIEKQEIETSLVVHDTISPEDRFRQISQAVLGRNPDIGQPKPELDITSQQIANVKTIPDIVPPESGVESTPLQIANIKTDTVQPSAHAKPELPKPVVDDTSGDKDGMTRA